MKLLRSGAGNELAPTELKQHFLLIPSSRNFTVNTFYLRHFANQGKSEAEVFDGFTVVNKFAEGGDTNFKVK